MTTAEEQNWGLSPEDAIDRMRLKVASVDRLQEGLEGIDPEASFWLGYETALHDFDQLTGENPVESGVVLMSGTEVPFRHAGDDEKGPVEEHIYDVFVSEKESDQ